ncbi:acetate--CoA ligase [Demequina sp. TTPB684]|uniref:acetate--CoA ligase n=1 Tax=unclassified Demequina TaxID=2620311 RepID=UPI001CF3BC03|nr:MULTISPECIES: acetate--CoA ligase [unclassified Demequina]MCB2412571.1 acetate--CoA ligase [Demequina sp. TTPB684]UPU87551.1 acetate--CoA ligase [Demequina sp. TMPB413]
MVKDAHVPGGYAPSRHTLENLHTEKRIFPPLVSMAAHANATSYEYKKARADRLQYWREAALRLEWHEPFSEILDWSDAPVARWFHDGTLNACDNAVDRHVREGRGDRVAFHFVGEPGDTQTLTYSDMHERVQKAARGLESIGIGKGDRVAIYLPQIPEAVVAMLACARVGAIHSVVFGGFSAESLRQRIDDAEAKLVITADGGNRRGSHLALKPLVDEALASHGEGTAHPGPCESVKHVLTVKRTGQDTAWTEGRDVWWHDVVDPQPAEHEPVWVESEHPLFILYTSGTTGTPKGLYHTTGGYLTGVAHTHRIVFDIKPETDVYWCTADVGWVTGHSYIVYGPMINGTTQVLYEGTPNTPHEGRWWEIVQEYKVTILYTAPTAIRTFMKWGEAIPGRYDLSSLRLLGSVGEPINPEAWMWYRRVIGYDRCPIVDTWWQTETGSIMISPLPGVTGTKPGSAMTAIPGIAIDVVDDAGSPVRNGEGGYLVVTEPWPAMLRGIWGDRHRYQSTYWNHFDGMYFAGDGAKKDVDGDLWLLGRVDDVMNVSGHRLTTTEIEHALVSHPWVAEAAVVGANDEITGQAVVAFVIVRSDAADVPTEGEAVTTALREHVRKQIGPLAKPRDILVVAEVPKTRSGKIMRRLLRDVAENRVVGDVTTLADSSVMDAIKEGLAAGKAD